MSFCESGSNSLQSWMHIAPFKLAIILRLGDGVEVIKIFDILSVIIEPHSCMEGHFIVLHRGRLTIRSRSFDSLEKI